jgi:hypothetical protein
MNEPRRPAPRPTPADENNLAEMAQRLEAALRRPTRPVEPITPPPLPAAPEPVEPVRPASRLEPAIQSRVAAYFDNPVTPVSEPPARPPMRTEPEDKPAKAIEPPPVPPPVKPPSYGSLEEEMASLLGRSSGKT